ncbi:mediator of RNA polymerase II transcription subunit 6 [Nematocida minor]|uniref:mediator of RNA polymerase II transcription subunit 6 n=1 Tax=Nematocida minor TaxID=1912983 RepID=UPI00221EE353|nr:mediator of RNA polymerase II transcription subunit 6 [Nematocida minor]KAI5191234.1 mediator of RNA polymerase II transcription subunit 6 [Nematocida minor]
MENTCFRDPIWLQHNLLTSDSILEYFSFSQFYDKNCNNEVLKMQTMHSTLSGIDGFLKKMCGIQYSLHYAEEPSLFIIKKYERLSPEKVLMLDYFYIMHGTVYQAPTESEVSRTRYTNVLFSMFDSLKDLPFQKPVQSATSASVYSRIEKKKSISTSRIAGLFNSYYMDYLRQ